ncbi:MAG: carbohydrate kinase family protein [Shimia sp.]
MIVVGGENLIDFVQREDGAMPPAYIAHPGGGPYNIALAAARQGAPVEYLSPISEDSLGDMLADRLSTSGAGLAAPRSPAPTSLAVVSLTDGQARYAFHRGYTAERQVTLDDLRAWWPDEATMFQIGSLALTDGSDGEAWEAFQAQCFAQGTFCAMDPNVRPSLTPDRAAYIARLERMFARLHLLKLSDEDLSWLYPDLSLAEAFDHVAELTTARVMVLTRGAEPAWGKSGATRVEVPAVMADPLVDTVGAGDTYMATLLRQVQDLGAPRDLALNAEELTRVMTTAARAAAINCTRAGCNPPTLAELMA